MITVDYQWIDNDIALAQLCESLSQQPAIALDTEFVRTRTYFAHIGLLQIADANGVYLIDPLALTNTQPLADLLINPAIVKVVHACSEDLEVFQYALGVLPVTLFDTQIAAGFAGYGASIGYANLLREVEDVDIPKHETRSDWLQRPLSDSQLSYAALDVVYLLGLYRTLVEQLQRSQRLSWVESDCLAIINKLRNTHHDEQYYLRIKSAWKLNPDQLAVLICLCRWRERQARERDLPRGRVIKDTSLFDIALKLPTDLNQLKRIQDMHYRLVDESGQLLLSMINDTLDDQADYPEVLARPLQGEQNVLLKKLKQIVKDTAEAIDLPQELLVRKKDYEALIRSKAGIVGTYALPNTLTDWRQAVIGDKLLTYLQSSSIGESL
jgi:ribonuclease D